MPAAKRIVALNWEAAENLLELGITPLAVADADDYRRWVAQPLLPAGGVGGQSAGAESGIAGQLEARSDPEQPGTGNGAPAAASHCPGVDHRRIPPERRPRPGGRSHFPATGPGAGTPAAGGARLHQLAQGFVRLRQQLQAHGARRLPRVQVIRFANASSVYVYGSNAMPVLALRRLGLRTTRHAGGFGMGNQPAAGGGSGGLA
jgi:iron complex transport system substrate-binding protein